MLLWPSKFIRIINLLEDSIIVVLVIAMMVLSTSSIVLRNMEIGGLTWADTAIRISVLWLAMFGALRASREQSHIAIDLISHYASQKIQRIIHFIVSVSAATICGIATYYSTLFVESERVDGMMAFLDVPAWACEAIIPFTLAVITLRFLIHSLNLPTPHEHTV